MKRLLAFSGRGFVIAGLAAMLLTACGPAVPTATGGAGSGEAQASAGQGQSAGAGAGSGAASAPVPSSTGKKADTGAAAAAKAAASAGSNASGTSSATGTADGTGGASGSRASSGQASAAKAKSVASGQGADKPAVTNVSANQRNGQAAGKTTTTISTGSSGSPSSGSTTAGSAGAGGASAAKGGPADNTGSAAIGGTTAGASARNPSSASTAGNSASSAYAHIVVVIEENHSYAQVVGNGGAPFLNKLSAGGALFTDAHGVTHPSQPNYIALFSGSTQGVTSDSCGKPLQAANLASELAKAKFTFTGYSEDLPRAGYTGCGTNVYARKHNPWAQFPNVPAADNQPLTSFPQDFNQLPNVAFVIPNVKEDMHDGTVQEADDWLKTHLGAYAAWAKTHNSLLIVTWDEDDFSRANHIPTIIYGSKVRPGKYSQTITHYNVLRFLEDNFKLPRLGMSAKAAAITGIRQP